MLSIQQTKLSDTPRSRSSSAIREAKVSREAWHELVHDRSMSLVPVPGRSQAQWLTLINEVLEFNVDTGLDFAKEALAQRPLSPDFALLVLKKFQSRSRLKTIERIVETLAEENSDRGEFQAIRVSLAIEKNDFASAEAIMAGILSKMPEFPGLLFQAARIAAKRGDVPRVQNVIATFAMKNRIDSLESLRESFVGSQDHASAYRCALALLELKIEKRETALNLVEFFRERKDLKHEYVALKKFLELNTVPFDELRNIAREKFKAGDKETALLYVDAAIRLRPKDPAILMSKGLSLLDTRERMYAEEAIITFEKVLELKPNFPRALLALGWARFINREVSEANQIATKGQALQDPKLHLRFLRLRAACLESTGDSAGGIAILSEALEQTPTENALWYSLALMHFAAGAIEASCSAVENAVVLAPYSPVYRAFFAVTLIQQKRFSEAAVELEKVVLEGFERDVLEVDALRLFQTVAIDGVESARYSELLKEGLSNGTINEHELPAYSLSKALPRAEGLDAQARAQLRTSNDNYSQFINDETAL